MLKFTGVKIELMTNFDQMAMVQKNVRGGIVQCSKKFAKANNKYLGEKLYNPKKKKILYSLQRR
jgi:hypothetical protein